MKKEGREGEAGKRSMNNQNETKQQTKQKNNKKKTTTIKHKQNDTNTKKIRMSSFFFCPYLKEGVGRRRIRRIKEKGERENKETAELF